MDLIHKELTHKIIGCAMQIHNTIGCGLREKSYENALCVEFDYQNIAYSQQTSFPLFYRQKKIDEFIPDLLIEEKAIIDAKVVENINDEHRDQMINYLKITGLAIGLIINFKHPKLKWERIVLEPN